MLPFRNARNRACHQGNMAETTRARETSERRIRAILDAAVDAIITIDSDGIIESFNRAAETMFGYSADEAIGRNVSMLMGSPYREQHDCYLKRYARTGERRVIGRLRELIARRKDGTEFPIQLSVSEIADAGIYTGIVHDMSEQRELQAEIVRVATDEQRRMGEELHDSTLQELSGLGLLARNLTDMLDGPELSRQRELAAAVATGIAETGRHLRQLAIGLVAVPIDADGLMTALADLAQWTQDHHGLSCNFVCPNPVHVADDYVAMHLYRIAQEAVTNAQRHSGGYEISIGLEHRDDSLRLQVTDNGIGIDSDFRDRSGLGLRIMEHRCRLIGGTFSVRRGETGGTVVSCELPHSRVS